MTTLPREVGILSLGYREAIVIGDNNLYAGLWNETTNEPEGIGALVTGNTLYEGWFKSGKAHGKGRKIFAEEREVFIGDFNEGLRSGDGVAHA